MDLNTYFYDEKHSRVGSVPGLVTVTKGMMIVVKEHSYVVEDVQLHLSNDYSEELGFRVFCKTNT